MLFLASRKPEKFSTFANPGDLFIRALKRMKTDIAASRFSVELHHCIILFFSGFLRAFYLKMWTYSSTLHILLKTFSAELRGT